MKTKESILKRYLGYMSNQQIKNENLPAVRFFSSRLDNNISLSRNAQDDDVRYNFKSGH